MKFLPVIALFLIGLASSSLNAQTIVWTDSFSGGSLNPLFSTQLSNSFTATQGGGSLTFSSSSGTNFAKGYIYTNKDQDGNMVVDEASIYNFFNRPITITLSDLSFSGTPSAGNTYSFFALLGTPVSNDTTKIAPRDNFAGAFVRLNKSDSGTYTLAVGSRIIESGGSASVTSFSLSGLPASLALTLDGANWTLAISGASFSSDDSAFRSGTFTNITEEDMEGSMYFSMGIVNYSTLDASSLPYSVSISNLEIAAVPEPGSVGLISLAGVAVLSLSRMAGRKKNVQL